MPRISGVTLVLFATALSAQTPAPAAPVPPIPPVVRVEPMPAPMPMVYVDPAAVADMADRAAESFSAHVDVDEINRQVREANRQVVDVGRQVRDAMREVNFAGDFSWAGGPVAWDQQDPADSLYREARDMLNRGDYRKAADLFKSLPQKYPASVYIGDAEYWQAFALYRIGGTPELQQALAVLEARKPDDTSDVNRTDARTARQAARAADDAHAAAVASSNGRSVAVAPRARTETVSRSDGYSYSYSWGGNRVDAAGLAARIASVLSSRGLAGDPAVKRALAAGGNACDPDDQSVRAEALNALMQTDPETGRQMAVKILANRDECSVPLRRNAVMLVGNKHDDAAVATLIPVAKTDPSEGVRMAAMEYLVQNPGDAAVGAVIDLERTSDDPQVQRGAVNALSESSNPKARGELRAIVENNSANESLRAEAVEGFDRDHMTADDATWLRAEYAKTTSVRIKSRIVGVVSRAGGEANNQWVMGIVRDDNEPLELRSDALNYAGRSMDVASLVKMYDVASQRPIREELIQLLGDRKEPEALDKVVDIAKNGTDPSMRREAISILARSKDPRASKLLLQLVDQK